MTAAPLAAPLALPNCRKRCGDVQIPFPFGVTEGCYGHADFLLSCNESSGELRTGNLTVTNISVEGQLEIKMPIAFQCWSENGSVVASNRFELKVTSFTVNVTQNVFMAVGCDSVGYLNGDNEPFPMGCLSLCSRRSAYNIFLKKSNSREPIVFSAVQPGAQAKFKCSGIGCCKVEIPPGVKNFTLRAYSFGDPSAISDNSCSIAFFVKNGLPDFSPDSVSPRNRTLPVVLDWAIGNKACNESNPKCGGNSKCHDPENGDGYRCKCKDGYDGNPHLPDGCQDIDECRLNRCNGNATCENTVGNFTCHCKSGYEGDGRGESGCKPVSGLNSAARIALGIGVSFATLLVAGSWLYLVFKQKKFIERKEKFFEQNGGLILKERLREQGGSTEGIKILTVEELEKATRNFDERNIIGRGGFGTMYKGILPGNRVIAIKKSRTVAQSQADQFINEIVVLSRINHRNVVKLLGCCLETKVPLLVYEFIAKGSLFKHIRYESNAFPLQWEIRLKIAIETAEAISYLHSTTIIHRDIKSANILLDNDFTAKVSNFGTSKLVPRDQKEIATVVQGTFGYLDPEYLQTNQLTEKSDVYSFGVVLVELLTGEEVFSSNRSDDEINLVIYFLSSLENGRLFNVLEKYIIECGNKEQIKEVVEIAKRYLKVNGDERPIIEEVAMELKRIEKIAKHPRANPQSNPGEATPLHAKTSDAYKDDGVGSGTFGLDSMTNQATLGLKDGR